MDDVKLILIAAAAAVVVVSYVVVRARERDGGRSTARTDLAPGIYLFTSATCVDCLEAHRQLTRRLGTGGFDEITWESDPDAFEVYGVVVVPATMIVGRKGRARIFEGIPTALSRPGGP